MVFIANRVPREVLWRCLEKKRVSCAYIRVVKDMYEGVKMSVRTLRGVQMTFPLILDSSGISFKPASIHYGYG